MSRKARNRKRRSGLGQSLVEFALTAPIFFLILAAIFDFGRAVFAFVEISSATNEGARQAILAFNQASNGPPTVCSYPSSSVTSCAQVPGVLPAIDSKASFGIALNYAASANTCSPPSFADGTTATYTPPTSGSATDAGTITLTNPQPNQGYLFIYETGTTLTHPDSCAATTPNTYWPTSGYDAREGGFNNAVVDIKYVYQPFFATLLPFLPNNGELIFNSTADYPMEY